MQQMEELAILDETEGTRAEVILETLDPTGSRSESVAEVAHDARNMVTALGLYCDLLEEPGVLAKPFAHYGNELRLVAAASRRLVEKLAALDSNPDANAGSCTDGEITGSTRHASLSAVASPKDHGRGEGNRQDAMHRWDLMPALPIANIAAELLANHNLLSALAGPSIALTVDVEGATCPVRMTGEELTRVLVNLVKNAAEVMPFGGRIQIELSELSSVSGAVEALALTVEDSGPGIPESALEHVFAPGFTTRAGAQGNAASWAAAHRGLGLAITRSIVKAAGGRIVAANRKPAGACFRIELPVRKGRL